jgi:hypothetical protein
MNRLFTLVGSTVVAGLVGWTPAAVAQPGAVTDGPGRRVASALAGHIEGVVVDEGGTPLSGAMVSALGAASAVAITDGQGAFALRSLPVGAYMIRAHLSGFSPSKRQLVDVGPTGLARFTLTLQRATATSMSAVVPAALPAKALRGLPVRQASPKLLSAGLAPASLDLDALLFDPLGISDDLSAASEDRTEKAWRIRHLPRSVLKDTTDRAARAPENAGALEKAALEKKGDKGKGRSLAKSVGAHARLLADLPFTGQLNVMTSSSFDAGPSLSSAESPVRGTANFSVAGPAGTYGDWAARIVTQADLGSWFLSGAFRNQRLSRNQYNVGFSYSAQRMAPGFSIAPLSIDRPEVAERTAGSIYGVGRFLASRKVMVDYGARYSRYDYLNGGGLFSPSVAVTVVPLERLRIRAGVSRRLLAPGAEEFLEPLTAGLWVPPERTFVGLTSLLPERTSQLEVSVERDLARGLMLSLRSFRQSTVNQQAAFFGGVPSSEGQRHYAIGNAGDLEAHGWSVGVTHHFLSRLRGSVTYEMTEARWVHGGLPGQDLLLLGYAPTLEGQRLHNVTTSLETDIPLTSTHVYVAYRFNTAFAGRDGQGFASRPGSRFDIQVTQRLPFLDFTSADWQVVVAVKNMFRDSATGSSIYDELLVVRPPTRVLGGFVVRF